MKLFSGLTGLLLALCILFWNGNASGQTNRSNRPSDKRTSASNKKAIEKIFGDDDDAFKATEIPEKWAKESAVVLHQKMEFDYLRNNTGIEFSESVRKRIKLLDKAAVNDFSEFYYVQTDNKAVGIKVIKPDGTENTIDLAAAVEVKTEVPSFYRNIYSTSLRLSYKKIAIPDLNPGDIIDFFYENTRYTIDDMLLAYGGTIPFESFRFTLGIDYPVVSQEIRFLVDRGFYVNFCSYNNAPEIIKEELGTSGKELKVRNKGMIKTYALYDKDRAKLEDEFWVYRYRENPFVKFQVYYSSPRFAETSKYFLGEMDKPNTKVSSDEIIKTLNRLLKSGNTQYVSLISADLRKYQRNVSDPATIVNMSYYYFRKHFLEDELSGNDAARTPDLGIGDYAFVSNMAKILDDNEIPFEVVVTSPKTLGKMDEILFHEDIFVGLYIKPTKSFVFPFSALSTPGQIPYALQSAEALTFSMKSNDRTVTSQKVVIPEIPAKSNVSKQSSVVKTDENMEELTIVKSYDQTGIMKDMPYLFTATATNLLTEDETQLYKTAKPARETRSQKLEKQKAGAKLNQKQEEAMEKIKADIKDEYDLVSYDKLELLESARFDDTASLQYEETYKIKGLINKAGRNYMFEIGKLIGSQISVSQDQRVRKQNIYLNYPRILIDEVSVELPQGYVAEGLQELSFNVDNPSITFSSSVIQEGNKLILKATKTYKKTYDVKTNWDEWLSGLDAANKFYQSKIILKKG